MNSGSMAVLDDPNKKNTVENTESQNKAHKEKVNPIC